jgi:hypothetical protein
MSKTIPRYRLVIFDAIEDPQAIRDPVCQVTGMHPTDVVQWLARAPGTWPRPLQEPEVRQFLDRLYEAGIAAEAWRTDQFPDLSPTRTIHRAACLDEGFRIEGLRGEPTHWVRWDRIELICAGKVSAEDEFRHVQGPRWPSTVVSGIRALALMKPRPSTRRARAVRIPRDPLGEVIVVRREPRIAFRAVESQMNYAYLGERLSSSAAENFPLFVRDLCAHSASAFVTPSTHALLERGECDAYHFASSQALLEYATHRLLWSWYRRDRDASARQESPDEDGQEETGDDRGTDPDTDEDMETPES